MGHPAHSRQPLTARGPLEVTPRVRARSRLRLIAGQIVGNELAGPAAGGWLFGLAAVLPFAVNAGTLGIAVLVLLTLPSFPAHLTGTSQGSRIPGSVLRQDLAAAVWRGRAFPAGGRRNLGDRHANSLRPLG